MKVLAIETSCDETAVALVESTSTHPQLLAQLISSQVELHRLYGGVVPEMATREHLKNLPRLVPQVLRKAGVELAELDAVAVTAGPGLASSLLIGFSYAQALGIACSKPVVGINHLEGHLFSPFFALPEKIEFPFIGLIASGGHTLLVHVSGWDHYVKLGGTVDDAAGEAFDKVARLLGLAYPGGPEIEKLAAHGNADAYGLPRSFPERDNLNFSFSGLKTAVRFFHDKSPQTRNDPAWVYDLCASFQKAVIDVLVRKTAHAVSTTGVKRVVASGGVLCNEVLRRGLETACRDLQVPLLVAPAAFCTDNAAMIACLAAEKLEVGLKLPPNFDVDPNLNLFVAQTVGDLNRNLTRARQLKDRQTKQVPQKGEIRAPHKIEVW